MNFTCNLLFLNKAFSKALISWKTASSRFLTARLKHRSGALTIIVAYAPTATSPQADSDDFYSKLEPMVSSTPPHDKLIILGDMNACTGSCRAGFELVIGRFGHGDLNDNSMRMLSLCASHNLSVLGSWFCRKKIHPMTWISNDGHICNELDHILSSDRSMFQSYRVYRGAKASALTNHILLWAEISLRFHKPSRSVAPRKLDLHSLHMTQAPLKIPTGDEQSLLRLWKPPP